MNKSIVLKFFVRKFKFFKKYFSVNFFLVKLIFKIYVYVFIKFYCIMKDFDFLWNICKLWLVLKYFCYKYLFKVVWVEL